MDSSELNHNWNNVCEQVKTYDNVNASQVNAFFSRLVPQAMSEGFLMLTADNDFIKSWVEQHYLEIIKQALNRSFPRALQRHPRCRRRIGCTRGGAVKPSDDHPRVSECSCEPGNNAPKCCCCPRTRISTDDRLILSFG